MGERQAPLSLTFFKSCHLCCAAVEAALQAMQRQQEAVAYCPASQLRGGSLVPDPPEAAGTSGKAAEDYAEVKLQLLDFSQVGALGSFGCC